MTAVTVLDLSLVFIFLWKSLPLQLVTVGTQDLAEHFLCSVVNLLTNCCGLKDCCLGRNSTLRNGGVERQMKWQRLELSLYHRT